MEKKTVLQKAVCVLLALCLSVVCFSGCGKKHRGCGRANKLGAVIFRAVRAGIVFVAKHLNRDVFDENLISKNYIQKNNIQANRF